MAISIYYCYKLDKINTIIQVYGTTEYRKRKFTRYRKLSVVFGVLALLTSLLCWI